MPRQNGMTKPAGAPRPRRNPIRVGDTVILDWGKQQVRAVVVEDRGHIGVGGRQILRIRRLLRDDDPDLTYEVPAEEVTPAD
jgi:hypothetical protein